MSIIYSWNAEKKKKTDACSMTFGRLQHHCIVGDEGGTWWNEMSSRPKLALKKKLEENKWEKIVEKIK